jgi:hypothetical protein
MTEAIMTSGKYILQGHTPVPCYDLLEWAYWFETGDRIVAHTVVDEKKKIGVSTVFLGLDHSFKLGEIPVLFESLVVGGAMDGHMNRYCTWEEAEEGHEELVKQCEKEAKTWLPKRLLNKLLRSIKA